MRENIPAIRFIYNAFSVELEEERIAFEAKLAAIHEGLARWTAVKVSLRETVVRQTQDISRLVQELKAQRLQSEPIVQAPLPKLAPPVFELPPAPKAAAFSFRDPLPAVSAESALHRLAAVAAKWLLIVLSVALSLRYLIWRALHTLNYTSDAHLAVSLALLCAEVYGFVSVLLFFLQVLAPKPVAAQPLEGPEPTVDLFVTIFGEPLDILHHTLVACKAIDYTDGKLTIHGLDDGRREDVRALAQRHGCRYLTRDDNKHAKAGNLNAALPRTSGEFILILDIDHLPVRSFLRETLGFFKDEKTAFVQTPHHFYNPDCYQRNLILESELVHEQDLFFQVIQPGRNDANAVVFCGSSAVFRRKALEDIGGFRVDCAIEDLHTGMELQARGWKGVYYRRILSAGLSPESFEGYLIQRKRWTKGGVQLFFLDNPALKGGLSLRQRLYYLASLLYFFHGWARMLYMIAPLFFLLLHFNPIVTGTWTLLWYFIPHYLASHFVFSMLTREYRSPFWSDVYEAASSYSLAWTTFATIFKPDRFVFKVTPKGLDGGRRRLELSQVAPHVVLAVLLILGIINATRHFMNASLSVDAYGLSLVWAAFNFILTACSIEVAREQPHRRHTTRLPRSYPVVISADGIEFAGETLNLSEAGALVLLPGKPVLPKHAVARIVGVGDAAVLECEVRNLRWSKEESSHVGLRFHKVSPVQHEQLIRLMFSDPRSWEQVRRPLRDSLRAFKDIAASVFRHRIRHHGAATGSGAVDLLHSGGRLPARLEELQTDRAVVSWAAGTEPVGPLVLRLPHRSDGELLVRVEAGELLSRSAERWTFALKFISPAKVRLGPVLDALTPEPA